MTIRSYSSEVCDSSVNSTEMLYPVNCVYIWDYRPTEFIMKTIQSIPLRTHIFNNDLIDPRLKLSTTQLGLQRLEEAPNTY
jgi:hypothetical protein